MENPYSLQGKTILVTGASSGIGRAIAIACSKMGAYLIITGRNENRLKETFSMLDGDNHCLLIADLTNEADRMQLINAIPLLDGIVQNAGIGNRILCKDLIEDDYNKVFDTNLKAPMLLQSLLLSKKKITKGASIVFIASRAASSPSIGNAIYSASKGAIISYAKCLALESAPRKIRVNCICPGMIMTDFIAKSGLDEEVMNDIGNKYPLKRYGKPEDVANLAVYLLSDASEWMTGSCIDISGGGEGILI